MRVASTARQADSRRSSLAPSKGTARALGTLHEGAGTDTSPRHKRQRTKAVSEALILSRACSRAFGAGPQDVARHRSTFWLEGICRPRATSTFELVRGRILTMDICGSWSASVRLGLGASAVSSASEPMSSSLTREHRLRAELAGAIVQGGLSR